MSYVTNVVAHRIYLGVISRLKYASISIGFVRPIRVIIRHCFQFFFLLFYRRNNVSSLKHVVNIYQFYFKSYANGFFFLFVFSRRFTSITVCSANAPTVRKLTNNNTVNVPPAYDNDSVDFTENGYRNRRGQQKRQRVSENGGIRYL